MRSNPTDVAIANIAFPLRCIDKKEQENLSPKELNELRKSVPAKD